MTWDMRMWGYVNLQQGKYQESIPYFQKALQIEPYFTTYSNLGTAYFNLKQYPQAVEMFEKTAALNPNDTMTAVDLADAYRSAGQKDKAHDTYQRAISLGYKELQTNPQDASVMSRNGAIVRKPRRWPASGDLHKASTSHRQGKRRIHLQPGRNLCASKQTPRP